MTNDAQSKSTVVNTAKSVNALMEANTRKIKSLRDEFGELACAFGLASSKLDSLDVKVTQVIEILSTFGAGSRAELKVLDLESDQAK